eukprot:TRINITY_DN895_c0_g1_i1.p1 TRINITY_DN895_c0_g1~~TRINITY_DN895_c0_g1_i1.p1  ORF type:complete len:194 (+),score=19.92 TRINITY_DN895_c0_g1_i1:35-583(+)
MYAEEDTIITEVDRKKDSFPLCIVWTPLPLLTWLLPFIGHLGIVTSEGVIHDFAGPYYVNRNPHRMGFGKVTKYWRVDLSDIKCSTSLKEKIESWDESIESSSTTYDGMMHNLICNNCHNHVAVALNRLNFKGHKRWNTFWLILYMALYGKYVNGQRFLFTWIGFFVILCVILIVCITKFLL